MATDSAIRYLPTAFTALNESQGFDSIMEKSKWGATLEFLRVTARCGGVDKRYQAHPSLPPNRVRKLTDEISLLLEHKGSFSAQMRKLVGALNFAQTALMDGVGRVAPCPLYDRVMRGRGALEKRPRLALSW